MLKFSQTSKFANVTPIVPGFASIYKSSVLKQIDINPPGLVIEDFNMTFEIHNKKLGQIAHHPSIYAHTQDPDNIRDYAKQIRRWYLGFWQTVRLHGLQKNCFSLALLLLVVEVLIGSLVIALLPLVFIILVLPTLTAELILKSTFFYLIYLGVTQYVSLSGLLLFIWLPDYLLSVVMAIVHRRPSYLFFGLFYLPLRIIDAYTMLLTWLKVYLALSTGRWQSPTRRGLASTSGNLAIG